MSEELEAQVKDVWQGVSEKYTVHRLTPSQLVYSWIRQPEGELCCSSTSRKTFTKTKTLIERGGRPYTPPRDLNSGEWYSVLFPNDDRPKPSFYEDGKFDGKFSPHYLVEIGPMLDVSLDKPTKAP